MTRSFPRRLLATAVTAVLLASGLAACTSGPSATLRVLAGSEVKDMAPILEEMQQETGIHLEFEYMGTLDGTEALIGGGAELPWDATWFPSNRYLTLFPEGQDLIDQSQSIMRSPVVLGVKPAVAQRLGWSATAPTWQEVVDAVDAGQIEYGMTSPIASNSGFITLVQAATALSGTGTVLTDADIDAVTPALKEFASGQSLASGSSGWLADRFVEDSRSADAIFNYESVLRGLTIDGQSLDIVIPSDGAITSDYPLTLLTSADEKAKESYATVVEYLQRPETQDRIAELTLRRTSTTAPTDAATVFELPFPARLQTVQKLLQTWVATLRKPANMVFAIDTSGSMAEGDRMAELHDALEVLSGSATSTSAGFLTLQPREQISYLEFAGEVKSRLTVTIPEDAAGYADALARINAQLDDYWPEGGTAIFDTVALALSEAAASAGSDRISSVVVFSDGQNTNGASYDDFERWYRDFLPANENATGIPVHVVLFAAANDGEMAALAELTGGRVFDARDANLASVFREIRGYL